MYSCTVKSDGQLHRTAKPEGPPPPPPMPAPPPPPPSKPILPSIDSEMILLGLVIFLVLSSKKKDMFLLAALGYILLDS